MKKNHSDTSGLDNILRELSARIKELMLTQEERREGESYTVTPSSIIYESGRYKRMENFFFPEKTAKKAEEEE